MAKTGVFGSDPTVMAKAMELKKELQKLVRSIVDDEDVRFETIDHAVETLSALKNLRVKKKSLSLKSRDSIACPEEFKCPISKELMRDPVIVATGQTYDRSFMQKWLQAGNRICPLTQQVLSHTILTPNHLIREMISKWCKDHGLELLDSVHYVNDEGITKDEHDNFVSLLKKLSSSIPSEQKEAAKELRLLTKRMPAYRVLFGECPNAISQLLCPLSQKKSGNAVHPDLQEDVITTLLNLSIHDNNKKLAAETNEVIPVLMEALKSGTVETRSNAAAALFSLAALDSNKSLIGKSGALKPLIDMLEEGHPLAMKDAASAIFTLCIIHENKVKAVKDGAVKVIVKKILEGVLVDELLAILAVLANHQRAIEEMGELGAIPCLFRIIKESSCERNKENCIAIIHTICFNDRTKLREVKEEEGTNGTISKLARDGTSRAQRKAQGILDRLRRVGLSTNTA